MQRTLIALLALLAAGAGGWFALSQQAPSQPPRIYAIDLDGRPVEIDKGGDKHTLVNFWASWCKPCVEELPLIERYAAEHADELAVVAVAIDTPAKVQAFLDAHPLGLPVAVGTPFASELMVAWGNDKTVLPFSVLLDPAGQPLRSHARPFDADSLRAFADLGG